MTSNRAKAAPGAKSRPRAADMKGRMGTSQDAVEYRTQLWVEAMIVNGGDATQAAFTVGYKAGRSAQEAGRRFSKSARAKALFEGRLGRAMAKIGFKPEEILACLVRDLRLDPVKVWSRKLPAESEALLRWAMRVKTKAAEILRAKGIPAPLVPEAERVELVNLVRTRIFEGCYEEQRMLGIALLKWAVPGWMAAAPDLVGTQSVIERGRLM